jgi:hypothetical protein
MLRLVSDEDVHGGIVRGLWRHSPNIDVVQVQDVGLAHTPDPQILQWAAGEGSVLITEDVNTMVGFAWARVKAGQPMPGVLVVRENTGIGRAINDILLVAECCTPDDIKDQVWFLPL